MLVGLILIEGFAMCFLLLLTLVIGIANGPEGMVVLYEKNVQERAITLGLTTAKKIKRSFIISLIALYLPILLLIPTMVYFINGARGFLQIFWQTSIISLMENLFDRLFVDWYWVGKTKAWNIPGTGDLKPYIPKKILIGKWVGMFILTPFMAAISALIFMCF